MFGNGKKNIDVFVGECLIDRDAAAADVSKSNVQMQITILGKKYLLHPTEVGCNGRIHRLTFNDSVSIDTGGRKSSVILFALTVRSKSAGRVKLCHTSCEGHHGEDQLKKLLFFNDTASGLRCGNVTIMMYAGRSPSNQTTTSIKGEKSLRNADKEYQFLRNRRLHWPNSRSSTFDQQMEGHLDADPAVSQKELEYMQKGHEMTPIKKSTKSAEIKRRRKFIVKLKRDIDREAKMQDAVGGGQGILTRRTAMGVGFVGAGWPETPDPKKKAKMSTEIDAVLGPGVVEDPEKVVEALNQYKKTMQRIKSAESFRRKRQNDTALKAKKKIQNDMNKIRKTRLELIEKEELMRDQFKAEMQKKEMESQKRKEEEQKKRKDTIAAASDEARRVARLGLQQNNASSSACTSAGKHRYEVGTSGSVLASPADTEEKERLRQQSIRQRTLAAEAFIKGTNNDFDLDMDDDDRAIALGQSTRCTSAPPRQTATSPLQNSIHGNFSNKGAKFGPTNRQAIDDIKMRHIAMRAVGDDSYNPKPPLPPAARGVTPPKSRPEPQTQSKGNTKETPSIYGHIPTRTRAPILPPEELPHFADPVIKGAYSMALQFTKREVQQLQNQRQRAGIRGNLNVRQPTTKKFHLHVPSSTAKLTKAAKGNKGRSEASVVNIPFGIRTKNTTISTSKIPSKKIKSKSKSQSKRSVFDIDVEEEVDVDAEIAKAKVSEKEDDESFDVDGVDDEIEIEPSVAAAVTTRNTTSAKSKPNTKAVLNTSKSISASKTSSSTSLAKTNSTMSPTSGSKTKSITTTRAIATNKKDKLTTPTDFSKKPSSPDGKKLKKTSSVKSKGKVIRNITGTGSNSKKLSELKSLKAKSSSPGRQLLLGSNYTSTTDSVTTSNTSRKFPPSFTTHDSTDSTKSPTRLAKSKSTKSPIRSKSLKSKSKSTSAKETGTADLADLHLSSDEPDFVRPTRNEASATASSAEEADLLAKLDSKIASLTAKAAALGASADRLDADLASDEDELGLGPAEEDRVGLDAYGAPSPKDSKHSKGKKQIHFQVEATDDLGLGLGLFSPQQKVSGAADANDWEKEIADALGDTPDNTGGPEGIVRRPSRAGHTTAEATDSDDEFDD